MIELHDVGVTYADAARPVLTGVALTIPEGELALVVGRTGSGKSTLLRTINGLVPPEKCGTRPLIVRSSVLLPEPVRPTTSASSPSGMVRSTPVSTGRAASA